MSLLQAAVDVSTSAYIKSRQAKLARLMGALSPPDRKRRRAIADLMAAIDAERRHRAAFGLGPLDE
jgi:hypothetical protein